MSSEQRDPQTYKIIGAAMEVHRVMGHGFLEAVYQETFAIELALQGIPFEREVDLSLRYKDRPLDTSYRADFLCFDRQVLVELKALGALSPREESQVLNYLRASGITVGLLLNFGTVSLQHKRLIWTPS